MEESIYKIKFIIQTARVSNNIVSNNTKIEVMDDATKWATFIYMNKEIKL